MTIGETTEKRFESDIEAFLISTAGGYHTGTAEYDPGLGLYPSVLIEFIKKTQPNEWKRLVNQTKENTEEKFLQAFDNACQTYGVLSVLRNGFKHRGISFKVCYFKPESTLNQTAAALYAKNIFHCNRQWYYSSKNKNSVDMVLVLNGIPVFAFELKNQYTGQTVDNAKSQWMYDRSPAEPCFKFNERVLAFFCVDHREVWMTTRLNGKNTYFLPFNQGSNGAGNDGGKGNPANPNGYPTAYFWERVFQADSMMDIIQKFLHLQKIQERSKDGHDTTKTIMIFPRFHQLDVVRKLIADVRISGAGKNYLIQHSAGSGKSNSIAWTAYRLASLHDSDNNAVFSSVIVVTDRRVLDAQLQATISEFEHRMGVVEAIDEEKHSRDLRDAINSGARIIITTLQKFPVVYTEINKPNGRNYAIIVDEAHSSQTGTSALKLKTALADTEEALKELAEIEGKSEEELDKDDVLIKELIAHGKHKNLSFFAFTATPKEKTLEIFGTEHEGGTFRPFHVYSMRQAIEEGFILDVLQNYMTFKTCFKIASTTEENPDLPVNRAAKLIRQFEEQHPYNIAKKAELIVETFMETTRNKINGKGKMMVVASSRLGAVKFFHEVKRYAQERNYTDVKPMVAFSGSVNIDGVEYSESGLNHRQDGTRISENQTKAEFHDNFNILIVAEKFQTGFDEPLLHTMIVDKKLKGVKAVQTLSRLNRTHAYKNDTFILDFVNTAEDIGAAFQPFYQETTLDGEVNTDLIYKVQKELRDYGIYDDDDIQAFSDLYFEKNSFTQGQITSTLVPIADRYNDLTADDRYHFRRKIRSFVKWYGYITQVVRMFDKDLHKEYVFCSFLMRLIPRDKVEPIDLEGKLKLEYYKLKKEFEGEIPLQKKTGVIVPPDKLGGTFNVNKKSSLEEIIENINKRYEGDFTAGDRVVVEALFDKLMKNEQLRGMVIGSDNKQMFIESQFPRIFKDVAQEGYAEQTEAYSSLFKDAKKYNAMMAAIGQAVYNAITNQAGRAGL